MSPKSTNSSTRDLKSRNGISSGGSSSSSNLAEIDGAEDVDRSVPRGGLRSSISKLGGLKAAWMKAAPERFISPKQIADEIRRLRRHDKTSVYERHRNFKYEKRAEPSPKFDELIPLISRLIDFADYRAKDYDKRRAAESEFFKLFAADPVIYEHFFCCKEITPWRHSAYRFGTFVSPHRIEGTEQEMHYRWSILLARNTFKTDIREETAQNNCDALKETFNIYGMAAIEYIPYAMGLEMQNDDLVLLHQLWDNFLDYVIRQYNGLYPISNVDLCFRNIVSSGKPLSYFASPSQMERIAMFLIGTSTDTPFIFSAFFPPPMFESRNPKDPYGANLVIRSPARNWDIVTASTYAIRFLDAYSKEEITNHFRPLHGKVFHTLSEFIEGEYGIGPLERTVFAKEESAFIDLYKTIYDAEISYLRSMGVLGKLEAGVQHALVALVEPSLKAIVIGTFSRKNQRYLDVPRGNFFIAHTVDIDRYHKHEMLENFRDNNSYIAILKDRVRFQTFYIDPEGICSLTYIPQFRNAPYLRRFKIGSRYFITADGLPESDPQIVNIWDRILSLQDVTIDKMPLDGQILTCLRVDQESPAFDCTGHYPILAGVDFETGEELYIAAVRREVDSVWYFSTIKDGASSVTYTDEIGEEHIARSFFVLALRHDPIDLPLQDVRRRTGAKDPTGPVYWVEIWPREDTQYSSGARLREDRLLESLLSDLYEWKIKKSIIDGLD